MQTPIFDVTTIGETMLRLSVPAGQRLEMMAALDVFPAGAEANIVAALSRLGRRGAWMGGLPDNPLGHVVANHLRIADVDLEGVFWDPDGRMGNYFIEFAEPPRPIQVIYDRADSVAARMTPAQVDWDRMLNTRLIHLTGITPALSEGNLEIVRQAIQRAKTAGVAVSFDINYRNKLWEPARAAPILTELIQEVDLLFCARGDAATVFDIQGSPEQIVEQLAALSHAKTIVSSVGEEGAVAWDGEHIYRQPAVPVVVIDRIGAGDGLAAGVVHGWLDGDLPKGLRYGTAMAALALSQNGDMIITTLEEVEAVIADASGGVNR
ncbi:MAG: sugar kinase [Chloroflexota bacterium]